jgi:cell division protein FtsB
MNAQLKKIRVMALSRQILALTAELETISRSKAGTAATIHQTHHDPAIPEVFQ